MLSENRVTMFVFRQSRDVLEASNNDCQTPRRPDKIHLQMEPGGINQTEKVSEAGNTSKEFGDDIG